jgi:hypothetical protein
VEEFKLILENKKIYELLYKEICTIINDPCDNNNNLPLLNFWSNALINSNYFKLNNEKDLAIISNSLKNMWLEYFDNNSLVFNLYLILC